MPRVNKRRQQSPRAGEDNPHPDLSELVRENEQLKERIGAMECIVQDLVARDRVLQSMNRPSPIVEAIPPEPAHHTPTTDSPSNGAIPPDSLPTESHVSADIDLRPVSRICTPLQDDFRCVERLGRSDQGHPHVRLGLLWYVAYLWCDNVHDIAVETWLKIIEGSDEDHDIWLWEDGDEVSLTGLLFREPKPSDVEYNAPVFLYAVTLRESVAHLSSQDWMRALYALQRRLDRSPKLQSTPVVGKEVVTTRYYVSERIQASMLLLLFSSPMRASDIRRGTRRLLWAYSSHGILDCWAKIHRLFYKSLTYRRDISDDDDFCIGVKDWFEDAGEWMMYLMMFYDIDDVHEICLDMMIGPCWCSEAEQCYIEKDVYFYLEPTYGIGLPTVLAPSKPDLRSMSDETSILSRSPESDWCYMPSLSTMGNIDIDVSDPEPPLWLVMIWVVFDTALSKSDINPSIEDILSQIQATERDQFLDVWSWSHQEETWLRRNATIGSPSAEFARWVNKYPSTWRRHLTHVTIGDWERLKICTIDRRNICDRSPYHFRCPEAHSLPKDGLLWIGGMVWLFLEKVQPDQRKVGGQVAPLDAVWFSVIRILSSSIGPLNFPPIQLTAVTAKFRHAVISSGHMCYRYSESTMALYAAIRGWLDYNENVPVTGIQIYSSPADRSCEVCKRIPQWKLESARAGSSSVYLLEVALKTFTPPMNDPRYTTQWLEEYTKDVIEKVTNFYGFTEREQSQCCDLVRSIPIYQRFIVYTFAHVKLCEEDNRLLSILKTSMTAWTSWDDISSILNHRVIFAQIWALLRSTKNAQHCLSIPQPPEYFHYNPHACDAGDNLKELLDLDILDMCARMANILNNPDRHRSFTSLKGKEAQTLLNLLQAFLDYPRATLFKSLFQGVLFKLSRKSGLYPECLVLKDLEHDRVYSNVQGTYGDVRKGKIQGSAIAIKQLRINGSNVVKVLKDFSHEAVIWRQLSHPNVLPFYGVYHLNQNRTLVCLISPWMENGTITDFLKENPRADRGILALDVAEGLAYLHTLKPHIIHGDLKGVNILITASQRACLMDFGLSTAGESRALQQSSASSARATGTLRWMAPESDIYSLACVFYEVFSDRIPHYEISNNHSIILLVCNGKKPKPLSDHLWLDQGLNVDTWNIMEECWSHSPSDRPTATTVVQRFRSKQLLIQDSRPPSDWDDSFILRLRSNLFGHPFCPPAVELDTATPGEDNYGNHDTGGATESAAD